MLPVLHPDAAGLDIGAEEIFVAVPADRAADPVRSFGTFTRDLHELADWLQQIRCAYGCDGIHGSVLDSALSDPRNSRV
jgi:hypothetical protein